MSPSNQLLWLNSEWQMLIDGKLGSEAQVQASKRIKTKLESLISEGGADLVGKLVNEILKRLQKIVVSPTSSPQECAGVFLIILDLSEISCEEINSQIPKLIHLLHIEISGRKETEAMERASETLAKVLCNSGILSVELIEAEIIASIEQIQDLKNEYNVLGGVLKLSSLIKATPSSFSTFSPQIFDLIWNGVFHCKQIIREKSSFLLIQCYSSISNNIGTVSQIQYYKNRIIEESIGGFRSGLIARIHGAILTLRNLSNISIEDKNFILFSDHYNIIIESLMKLITHKESIIRHSSIELLSHLSGTNIFCNYFLFKWMNFLIDSIRKEKDRLVALKALHITLISIESKAIEPYLDIITLNLKYILQQKGKYREINDVNYALNCIATLSELFKEPFKNYLFQLLPALTSSGSLWFELIISLKSISKSIPETFPLIEDFLIFEVKRILNIEDFNVNHTDLVFSYDNISMALLCLGTFNFTERILFNPFFEKALLEKLLNHSHYQIRCDAAQTTLRLCKIALRTDFSEPVWILRRFLSSVLTRMVADENYLIPEVILFELDNEDNVDYSRKLDMLLSHSDCLRPLFIFLGSNNVPIRLRFQCVKLLSRVVSINFAAVISNFRKLLLQYLSEIECIKAQGLLHREESANLLYQILLWNEAFVAPYVDALLRRIIPKIIDRQVDFAENMLLCVGRLVQIRPGCVVGQLQYLLDILCQLSQDQSSVTKRKAALSVIRLIISKVDRVYISKDQFCNILSIGIAIMKSDLDHFVRNEAIRLIGAIGAIDPYFIKYLEAPLVTTNNKELCELENLNNLKLIPEEFFANIAVISLIKVLKDSTLSMHHMSTTQVLVYLLKSLGPRSHQFLNQILPVLYTIMGNCSSSSSEFYFQQLSIIVGVVGVYIRPRVEEIIALISSQWDCQQPCYIALLDLIDVLAQSLKGEFKIYIPRILPAILSVLDTDPSSLSSRYLILQKTLQTVSLLEGQISDYAGIVGDSLVLILRSSSNSREICVTALRATASICKNVTTVADNPAILQSLIGIVESSIDPEIHDYCLDAIVVVGLAQGRDFFRFIPLLAPIINRKNIKHAAFEKLISTSLNSPAKFADMTNEALRLIEFKIKDLTLISGDFSLQNLSIPPQGLKLSINENLLLKNLDPSACSSRDDWFEWIRRLGIELLREAPSPSIRSCASLANIYYPLGRELFNAAFASCLPELSPESQHACICAIEIALSSLNIPSEVAQILLNLAEFMERLDRPLSIDIKVLGNHSWRFHAFAKALYYKELEFNESLKTGIAPAHNVIESLISINNQIQQPDAALGILIHAHRSHGIVLKESWYEKLQRWDEALKAYEIKWQSDHSSFEAIFGILRCRHALGEWDELNDVAQEIWPNVQDSVRKAIAPLAAASALGLQDWTHLETYVDALNKDLPDFKFFKAILAIHSGNMDEARLLIDATRDLVDTELTALISESYSRAYSTVVRAQMLTELEEVSDFIEEKSFDSLPALIKGWSDRLELCQSNVEVWLRILKVRSLLLTPKTEPNLWIKFASMCRKSGRPQLAKKILCQLLNEGSDKNLSDSDRSEKFELSSINISKTDPKVLYAYFKYVWECEGERHHALNMMKAFCKFLTQSLDTPVSTPDPGSSTAFSSETLNLLSACYYKSSVWEKQLLTEISNPTDEQYKNVLDGFLAATSYDKSWHKAWHGWALMNFEMASTWERKQQQQQQSKLIYGSKSTRLNPYIVPAIQGFFRSISLSTRNSLQDSLRLLTLWFKYGSAAEINAAIGDGFFSVPVDNWLQVIPQLIARIHIPSPQVRRLVHHVLNDIGKHHPQALVYSLTVAAKSQNSTRKTAAIAILDKMRAHSANLVDQALLLGQELIRVAILWEEMWYEGLEEASKLYFGEHNIPAMYGILEPLHQLIEKGGQSVKELVFIQSYGHELKEARDLGTKYKQTGNSNDLNAAWDLYYQVFRRINKSLPQLTYLDLENVSPKLLKCKNLEIAIPGTYRADTEIVRISSIISRIGVISSKQRPRKLIFLGSDGHEYQFLLKGHEDLRQDERVMQFFGLVNTLLQNDPETHKRHLAIERFSVIPLSQNTGLIGWLPQCDTMHSLIKNYRETRGIPLSLEHRTMLQFAPDYDHLTKIQKIEVFEYAMRLSDSSDLARIFWLISKNAEAWFERRTSYNRSLAVMSMVGYVLGLGDRHPSNIMFDQCTGKIVHIDFGDCFEVAMERERFPERVPFRLTVMLLKAMEASGIEGTFRITCEETMRVLRSNKDSLMAVLEAFVYDPLINWRLLTRPAHLNSTTTDGQQSETNLNMESFTTISNSMATVGSWAQFPDNFSNSRKIRRDSEITQLEEESLARPEALNSGAISVINRVSSKLTGKDFRDLKGKRQRSLETSKLYKKFPYSYTFEHDDNDDKNNEKENNLKNESVSIVDEWPLTVPTQVDRLIHEATKVQNLCQSYVGWCPFW